MDLLANYDDDNTGENSVSPSPKPNDDKLTSNMAPTVLENEWLSFEQMIAPGGGGGNSEAMKSSEFLVNGIVAYPGMKSSASTSNDGIPLEDQSSKSSDNETGHTHDTGAGDNDNEDEDDAFFRLRKQVKEQDRSSSSDGSGSSRSSSSSRSPSPPHLSPVNSIKSHESDPPDLTQLTDEKSLTDSKTKDSEADDNVEKVIEKPRSRSKDRKRSHRDSSSKHDHHSSSKRRRSRSHSKDRKRRSKDHHRRKDKKSRDRRSRRDSRRSRSRDRKNSKSESKKSESHEHNDTKDSSGLESTNDRRKSESNENKDSKSERHRSRSADRKDRKKKRRSRSRSRHRHRSKDRKSKERKRSKSRDRKKKHHSRSRSRDRRSRSRDRRSRSRHRDRYTSRSRSRERLRSRSPVLGRKLTFKEQMRKEFINASKEMSHEQKAATELDALRKPGESLRPSDLLKGVKLTGGDSVTPQMALMQTMAAMHKKAQELTGVEVPKYYNPAAVNPLKYAEQVQKRKLLWSKKTEEKDKNKNEQIESQWKSAFIGGSEDDKAVSKFRKLMGMKGEDGAASAELLSEDVQKMSEEQRRKQAELFQRLDQEYQFARMTTHTQRGVGLGFSTTVIDPNHPQHPP